MDLCSEIGIQVPRLLLPRADIDLAKWAVIACDQFTSQPEYWQEVEEVVGDAPSTLHLILPEIYLGEGDEAERVATVQANMRAYLADGIFTQHDGMVYVEREVNHQVRKGLLVCLDLEQYDYHPGSQSLARATEATIVERLPARMRIRQGAILELPHILVLIDDPDGTAIEPLSLAKSSLRRLYDFDLMLGGGHLAGYLVDQPVEQDRLLRALVQLNQVDTLQRKYQTSAGRKPFLYAIGDGNHSLAAAKVVWEQSKHTAGRFHPARYALVEIVNLHDPTLFFEPIHRLLFTVKVPIQEALSAFFHDQVHFTTCGDRDALIEAIAQNADQHQLIGLITASGFHAVEFNKPLSNLTVGILQAFLDDLLRTGQAVAVDYVHGEEALCELSRRPENAGFLLPALDKHALFRSVIFDGVLPSKSFSIGKALEKRFYLECRSIQK